MIRDVDVVVDVDVDLDFVLDLDLDLDQTRWTAVGEGGFGAEAAGPSWWLGCAEGIDGERAAGGAARGRCLP
jgi:hypothetical protein